MFEFRQSLQAEYHDGEENNEDRDDGDYPGVLTRLRILEQQPNPSLQIIGGEGFLLFLDESFIFPEYYFIIFVSYFKLLLRPFPSKTFELLSEVINGVVLL